MWIFTTGGFVSAVQHRDDDSQLMVRGRDRESLINMLGSINARRPDEARELLEDAVYSESKSDYRWRVVVSKEEFIRFLVTEVTDYLNYENYKKALTNSRGEDFHSAAMDVWVAMLRIQTGAGRKRVEVVHEPYLLENFDLAEDELECQICGGNGATMQQDPYAVEIHGDTSEYPLCETCVADLVLGV